MHDMDPVSGWEHSAMRRSEDSMQRSKEFTCPREQKQETCESHNLVESDHGQTVCIALKSSCQLG
jgi:hypothetical protein